MLLKCKLKPVLEKKHSCPKTLWRMCCLSNWVPKKHLDGLATFVFNSSPLVPHICVSELGQHWFRWWLVAWSAPSHFLNQCWNIVNWALKNKLHWNFTQNTKRFIHEKASENIVCEIAAVLSRWRWVNTPWIICYVLHEIAYNLNVNVLICRNCAHYCAKPKHMRSMKHRRFFCKQMCVLIIPLGFLNWKRDTASPYQSNPEIFWLNHWYQVTSEQRWAIWMTQTMKFCSYVGIRPAFTDKSGYHK